jgi:hypothetical protein
MCPVLRFRRALLPRRLLCVGVFLIAVLQGHGLAQNTAPIPLQTSGWVATDALGRQVPEPGDVGIPTGAQPQKWVGMFYYIWHGHHGDGKVHDLTRMIHANPANPTYGPKPQPHWWGEPEAGYYRADDPWVIRRNLHMMASAGIDFLFFDMTNGLAYPSTARSVCRTIRSLRASGVPAPSIVASVNGQAKSMTQAWDSVYLHPDCRDLVFQWEGKPLMLGTPETIGVRQGIKDSLTLKHSWANTKEASTSPDKWQWMDSYPQSFGWSGDTNNVEQMPVSSATGGPGKNSPASPLSDSAVNFIGKSFSGGVQPPTDAYGLTAVTDQGRFFEEQWKRVHAKKPKITMVTQWNEWTAQHFECGQPSHPCPAYFLGRKTRRDTVIDGVAIPGTSVFIDVYNREFNRDIEPMKGGWTDNYYYQMVSHVRRIKGIPPMAKPVRAVVAVDGSATEWKGVQPEYLDWRGDAVRRDWPGYQTGSVHRDSTNRNDIARAKVVLAAGSANFLVEAEQNLSPSTDTLWMQLLIDIDRDKATGWNGYDYLVGGAVSRGTRTLHRWTSNRWSGYKTVTAATTGKALEVMIRREDLGLTGKNSAFEFKWADNTGLDSLVDFSLHGDAGPDRRWNFLFRDTVSYTLLPVGTDRRTAQTISVQRIGRIWEVRWASASTEPRHVRMLDLSGRVVGEASATESYLRIPAVARAAILEIREGSRLERRRLSEP